MINIVTLFSLALATLHMAVTPASAHGYDIYPPSRQARCKAGEVPHCGDVQWDAHSVEAPKGSFKCNGDGTVRRAQRRRLMEAILLLGRTKCRFSHLHMDAPCAAQDRLMGILCHNRAQRPAHLIQRP